MLYDQKAGKKHAQYQGHYNAVPVHNLNSGLRRFCQQAAKGSARIKSSEAG